MNSKLTINDLIRYALKQQRLDSTDYGGCRESYQSDRRRIVRAKKSARAEAGWRWHQYQDPLRCGSYYGTRLNITEDKIDYIPGQYAPTEIWHAVEDYFYQVRRDNESA